MALPPRVGEKMTRPLALPDEQPARTGAQAKRKSVACPAFSTLLQDYARYPANRPFTRSWLASTIARTSSSRAHEKQVPIHTVDISELGDAITACLFIACPIDGLTDHSIHFQDLASTPALQIAGPVRHL